jgi:putative transcriptional regulator
MAIQINLDNLLRERGVTSKELCELVGITEANMSILRSGKAKAIRFSTLDKLCRYLDCKPGDILKSDGNCEEDENEE